MAEKSMKQEDEECRKFLEINGGDLKTREEIKKCYDYISTNYINERLRLLLNYVEIKKEEKETIMRQLPNNIKEIIENLNPLYQCTTQSMNINQFIKVKKLKENSFRTEVVRGFAMTKELCTKNMGVSKVDANILLLDFDLNEHKMRDLIVKEPKKENTRKNLNNNNITKNESLWADDIYKAIESLDVNVILISKGIDTKLLEKFKEKSELNSKPKPIIAIDVKSTSLEKLSLCTKAKIISSLEEFNNYINNNNENEGDKNKKSNFLGCCKSFQTVDIKKFYEEKIETVECKDNIDDYKIDIFENNIYRPKFKLMKFDIRANFSFHTLLISGNNKSLLDIIKKTLKEEIFITVRDFFLQQKVLHYLFCKVEYILPNNNNNINNNNDNNLTTKKKPVPSLIKQKFNNNLTQNKGKIINENQNIKNDDIIYNKKSMNGGNTENKTKKNLISQSDKVNNINIIKVNTKDDEYSSSLFSRKNQIQLTQKSLSNQETTKKELIVFKDNILKRIDNKILETNLEESNSSQKSSFIKEMSGNIKNNILKESSKKISNFSLGQNDNNNIIINLNEINIVDNDLCQNVEKEQKDIIQFGFDTSIISQNEKKITCLKLIKLKMCEGDKNFNQVKTETNTEQKENNEKIIKQKNINNETELLKKLNYICGNPEEIELIFYDSDSKKKKDKQFGKFIIDMIADKYKKCEVCKKKNMSKHFYYLYSSDSRIKISYISKEDYELENIIKFINNSKKIDFKYLEDITQITEEDYNTDIFSYGFCKICKKIVTPLIKMPKDFFAYSTAKIFNHILNNSKVINRKGIDCNISKLNKLDENMKVINIYNDSCEHFSFHQINRIFLTKFGALELKYQPLKKYCVLSVQKSPPSNTIEKKYETINIAPITESKQEGKEENQTKPKESRYKNFFDIIDIIAEKFFIEKQNIECFKKDKKENENYDKKENEEKKETKKTEKIDISNIIESVINLLTDITIYMSKISVNKEEKKNELDNIEITTENATQRPSLRTNNESKEKLNNLKDIIDSINPLDESKKIGLPKRISFRIAQMKILYNKIRILIHKIKLYISLEQTSLIKSRIIKDTSDLSKDIKGIDINNIMEKRNDNEDEINESKPIFLPNPNNITKQLSEQPNKKIKIELIKQIPTENLIKSLIDNYISLGEICDNETNNDNMKEYLEMLETITFYEEKPNDYSNIIKEYDLSSIIYYAISSTTYKNFMKEKTNLLEFKNNEGCFSNTNSTHIKYQENENYSERLNEELYKSLLIFDSLDLSDKKNNPRLEAEILKKEDKKPLSIKINSITPKKLYPNFTQSRKQTISIPAAYSSPNISSPQNEDETEKKLDLIEDKISGFYMKLKEIKNKFKILKKEKKTEKRLSEYSSILKNISSEYNTSLSSNQSNKENNNENDIIKIKKKVIENFSKSLEEFIKNRNQDLPFAEKPENVETKQEEIQNNVNLIDLFGNLHHIEDKIQKSEIEIKIYFPRQFEALRIVYCSTYEDLLVSMMESDVWKNVSGGKSKATFYKTKDEKYLFKSIKQNEFNMFLEMGFNYFQHMDEYLFHKMPSLLMKILGVYKIHIKKEENGITKEENYYLMMMENMNYGLDSKKIISYDLKGSEKNRYISKSKRDESKNTNINIVLYDSNFKEDFKNEPIPINKQFYDLLNISVHNDTLFLSKMGVVDYSLLLQIYYDEKSNVNYIRMGIIDYIRKYTWDKQIEHYTKFFLNGFVVPTITKPNDYKNRFQDAIKNYFICV